MKLFRPMLLSALVFAAIPARAMETFHTEQEALTYCRGGGIVWLDLAVNLYVYKGSARYGKGKNSVFVCETDAIGFGAHAAGSK